MFYELAIVLTKILISCFTTKVNIYWLSAIKLILFYNQKSKPLSY
jgi:hypothetical protein